MVVLAGNFLQFLGIGIAISFGWTFDPVYPAFVFGTIALVLGFAVQRNHAMQHIYHDDGFLSLMRLMASLGVFNAIIWFGFYWASYGISSIFN
jgi:hypothetical protein